VSADSRTPEQITADIAETRERLATTIDTLVTRAAPKTIVSRQLDSIKSKFVTPEGSPNFQTIGKVAGGVLGFVVLVVAIRKVTG
jgi:hypothetical protein